MLISLLKEKMESGGSGEVSPIQWRAVKSEFGPLPPELGWDQYEGQSGGLFLRQKREHQGRKEGLGLGASIKGRRLFDPFWEAVLSPHVCGQTPTHSHPSPAHLRLAPNLQTMLVDNSRGLNTR